MKGPGGLGSWQTSGDYPNDSIIENGQNTEDESWRLGETCCHLNSNEKPSANNDVKHCKGVNNNNNNNNCLEIPRKENKGTLLKSPRISGQGVELLSLKFL